MFIHRNDLVQHYLVPPVVAEIVNIEHGLSFDLKQFGKLRSALVYQVEFIKVVVLWDAPILAVLLELV